jgi:type II secretory pathway pseudopilin PulG
MNKLVISKTFKSQSGQTLVDVIIGFALMSSSIASAGVIATTSSRTNAEAGRRSEAMALAQREIEGLRIVRDTSERGTSGWTPLSANNSTCNTFTIYRSGSAWSIGGTGGANADGLVPFTAANTGENSAFETQNNLFRRLITACPATDYAQSDATSLNPNGPLVGTASTKVYNITVTVKWPEGAGDKQVTVRSIMSDWKQR